MFGRFLVQMPYHAGMNGTKNPVLQVVVCLEIQLIHMLGM